MSDLLKKEGRLPCIVPEKSEVRLVGLGFCIEHVVGPQSGGTRDLG